MTATPESQGISLQRSERFVRSEYPAVRRENPLLRVARRFGEVILSVLDRYRKDAND